MGVNIESGQRDVWKNVGTKGKISARVGIGVLPDHVQLQISE